MLIEITAVEISVSTLIFQLIEEHSEISVLSFSLHSGSEISFILTARLFNLSHVLSSAAA